MRPEYEAGIFEDLAWLGLDWPEPVLRQSQHLDRYAAALKRLSDLGLTYPCRCSRADIRAALSAPQEGATHLPPDGAVYPGTCRGREMDGMETGDAVRLHLDRALAHMGGARLDWREEGPEHAGCHALDPDGLRPHVGDVVLASRDSGTAAYHLAVVVDDAEQDITHVIRGEDLWEATPVHRLLQALLGLPVPVWHHHRLIRDEAGKRLAKRHDARALRTYRAAGRTPAEIRAMVGLPD